jgi:hypothetical protein
LQESIVSLNGKFQTILQNDDNWVISELPDINNGGQVTPSIKELMLFGFSSTAISYNTKKVAKRPPGLPTLSAKAAVYYWVKGIMCDMALLTDRKWMLFWMM